MTQDAIPDSWRPALEPVLQTPEARKLGGWLRAEEEEGKTIYPPRGERLAALSATPLDQVRVVILGQDPYHGPGQAHGLSFSVREEVKLPPSLRNIFKELESDLGVAPPTSGDLTPWAKQGVLLLNNTLTVEAGQAGSHAGRGWDALTDACVEAVAASGNPCVFVLWGSHAKRRRGGSRGLGARSIIWCSPRFIPARSRRIRVSSARSLSVRPMPFLKPRAVNRSTGRCDQERCPQSAHGSPG